MAQDPAFLFYPGDYLRDTQCLSEKVQVAYDRIICEHMRNICISQQRLDFFSKKLTEEEKAELLTVLAPVNGGYQITWVANSIMKYSKFRESRSNNRKGKIKNHVNNISTSHDEHMENENENDNTDVKEGGVGETSPPSEPDRRQPIVQAMKDDWLLLKPGYPFAEVDDLQAIFVIGEFIGSLLGIHWLPEHDVGRVAILEAWKALASWIVADDFYKHHSLSTLSKTKNLQTIWQKSKEPKNGTPTHKTGAAKGGKSAGAAELANRLSAKLAARGQTNPGG